MPAEGTGALHAVISVVKEVWVAFVTPAVLAWFGYRKWAAARSDAQADSRRTEQQRADAAFQAAFARLDDRMKGHVEWQERERLAAVARADRAEELAEVVREKTRADIDALRAAHDAATRRLQEERWRLELLLLDREHDVNNLRQIVDILERDAGKPARNWPALERPKPSGEGA